jgi:hypothetical protein
VTSEEAVTSEPTGKPTVSELGIDLAAQAWRRSGHGDGAIEVAFAHAGNADRPERAGNEHHEHHEGRANHEGRAVHEDRAEWVLMRVTGDPEQRVLVFDRHEWECFLDGARQGEFDDATDNP